MDVYVCADGLHFSFRKLILFITLFQHPEIYISSNREKYQKFLDVRGKENVAQTMWVWSCNEQNIIHIHNRTTESSVEQTHIHQLNGRVRERASEHIHTQITCDEKFECIHEQ